MEDDATPLPSVRELLDTAVSAIGGQERSGQLTMAEAVDNSLHTGQHVAIQAGTGTGKSLAYLVPALRYAVETGQTIVVSTATIALQRQLCGRDIPQLVASLADDLGRKPTFALLKGRGNYLCKQALAAAADPDVGDDGTEALIVSEAGKQAQRVHQWATETKTGDRDDLIPGVSDLVWRTVSVDTGTCLGTNLCPYALECFAEEARRQAARADIVVTNHSMLAIDATSPFQLLPDHAAIIVDEAHELEGRVTNTIAASLSPKSLDMLRKRTAHFAPESDVDNFAQAIENFVEKLKRAPAGRWETLPAEMEPALILLRSAANNLLNVIGPVHENDVSADPAKATAKKQAKGGLDDVVAVCDTVTSDSDTSVVWMSDDEKRGPILHTAPIRVGGILREQLFRETTMVLTSATLQVGGSFVNMAHQWGLPAEQEVKPDPATATANDAFTMTESANLAWTGIDVGSPLQHSKAGILYVAADLPKPGRDGTAPPILERCLDLIKAAGGRTLVLCSSRRGADEFADYLRNHLETEILCQGDDSTSSLITQFQEDEESCLVGTLTLWQGVDVPGMALSQVIIDRIPFPRPDDPLMSARQRAVDKAGGNGFMTVAAAHAALLLAQGTGRLLRSETDRGVISVLDPRLVTARYAGFLRRSLPDYWETTDKNAVLDALRRLTYK